MNSSVMKPGTLKITYSAQGLFVIAASSWIGLVFGYGEVLFRLAIKYFLNQLIFMSPHFVWMAPLVYLLLFSAIGCLFALAAKFWPKLAWLSIAVFICTFLGVLGIYFVKPILHIAAFLVLALGVASQLGLLVKRYPDLVRQVVFRSLPWMIASLGIIVIINLIVYQ